MAHITPTEEQSVTPLFGRLCCPLVLSNNFQSVGQTMTAYARVSLSRVSRFQKRFLKIAVNKNIL